MNTDKLPFNWFDLVVVAVLVVGILRGRKRGMSEELIPLLQWIATIFICAFAYQPLGDWLAEVSLMSRVLCYVTCYVVIGIVVSMVFLLVKRGLHGKLIGSDRFGSAEYYLGMPSGMLRFACMLIAALALLNARLFTPEEIRARQLYQQDVYGSEFFPGLEVVQANVFQKSLIGPPIKEYLGFLLIEPTLPNKKQIQRKEWNMPGL